MSPLEEDIRDSLRSEAVRLREVRPLLLPPVAALRGRRRALRVAGPRWQRPWQAPVMAAAAIVLVAAALVTAKMVRNGSVVPPASPGPATATSGQPAVAEVTPRYYVRLGWGQVPVTGKGQLKWAIFVEDLQTGKTLGSYNAPKGDVFTWAASAAADNRTFVVAVGALPLAQASATDPARFYRFRIFPGTAHPVRVTPLAIQATPAASIALSADGTELAVMSRTGASFRLGVYSVATGRLKHSWSADVSGGVPGHPPVADLSWAGDGTVAFALIQAPNVRQEVRTLDVSAAGTSLLADSRVVWSQYVPPPAGGKSTPPACERPLLVGCGTSSAYGKGTPRTCDTPFLTGDGQAVVCGTQSYSASTKRLSAVWLAYPLAAPGRPRVLGSATVSADVNDFNGPIAVEWTNSSGTEVIGSWNPQTLVYDKTGQVSGSDVTNNFAFIGGGKVSEFPWGPGMTDAAW
jgi:hypothetical protein